eukprot:scaffold32692_cov68-Phaeocystis_antarctica.AAC.1
MEHIKRGKKKGKRKAQEITVHLPNLPGRCCHEAPTVTEACRLGTPTVTARPHSPDDPEVNVLNLQQQNLS